MKTTMCKSNPFVIVFLIVALLFNSSATAAFAASSDTLIKEYEFDTRLVTDDYDYDAPEMIEENNTKYKLIDIDYEVIKDNYVEIKKTVTTNDKTMFSEQVEHKLANGKTIILNAHKDEIVWEEDIMRINQTKEYSIKSEIPSSIKTTKTTKDGEIINITLEKVNIEENQKTEDFSAPAKFYSPTKDTKRYIFNNKLITVNGEPTWSGFEADVKDYLGINGKEYTVSGGHWTGEPVYNGKQYVRTAVFTGKKTVPYYNVTYIETQDTARTYTAEITYFGYDGDAKIKAIATYEKMGLSFAQKMAIGAGVLAFAALIVLILYVVAKRRKENKDELPVKGI